MVRQEVKKLKKNQKIKVLTNFNKKMKTKSLFDCGQNNLYFGKEPAASTIQFFPKKFFSPIFWSFFPSPSINLSTKKLIKMGLIFQNYF